MSEIVYEKISRKPQQFVKIIHIDADNINIVIPKHWHRSLEIIYPKQGYSELWLNGELKTIQTGDFYIINSQSIHTFYPNNSHYEGYAIQIDLNFIKFIFPQIESLVFLNDYNPTQKEMILEVLEKLVTIHHNETKEIEINGYALVLMSKLISSSVKKNEKLDLQNGKNLDLVLKIMAYIDDHFSDKLSPQSLAQKCNMSYGYFSRVFKKSTGITVSQYIQNQRLEKAMNDLKFSTLNITQIALNNGFSDYKSFDRMFIERYQLKPTAFRKKITS